MSQEENESEAEAAASGFHQMEGLAAAGGSGGVERVLSSCLSPPSSTAVSSAVRLLKQIGAFDDDERLTALGTHLNRMPMDPRVGKWTRRDEKT